VAVSCCQTHPPRTNLPDAMTMAAQGADCFAAMISNLEALYRAYEARDRYIANAANGKAEAETADIYCDDTLKCRKQLKPQSVTWSSRRHRALALLTTQRASGCL
jgi:hypothetical protein